LMFLSLYTQRHAFHLVDPSIMPLLSSFSAFVLTTGSVLFFHGYWLGFSITIFGVISVLCSMFLWWRDIVREGSFEGFHTSIVQLGLRYGMILFIISEIMFFFAFFWAFFSASLSPSIEIGNIWPPKGLVTFDPKAIPLLNTLLLLCSGVTITYSHHAITCGNKVESLWALVLTLFLACLFTLFQIIEYLSSSFNITDSVFGSVFFLATGFHGFHVLIGTLFIFVCLYRLFCNHFSMQHHFGFEAAAFYWHFVDVVWLFLYIVVYFWGGS